MVPRNNSCQTLSTIATSAKTKQLGLSEDNTYKQGSTSRARKFLKAHGPGQAGPALIGSG